MEDEGVEDKGKVHGGSGNYGTGQRIGFSSTDPENNKVRLSVQQANGRLATLAIG